VVEDEIRRNRQALAELLGMAPSDFKHFCYPSGLTSAAAATALADIGMTTSVTTIQGLAWPGAPSQLLSRLHDGENVSDLEFEAELSGFSDWLRQWVRSAHALLPSPVKPEVTATGKLRFGKTLIGRREREDMVPPS
jgi:hypothetical protein